MPIAQAEARSVSLVTKEVRLHCRAHMVVPPASAAAWPDAKSSTVTAPMKGISRCVCGSMPPGSTSSPVALRMRAPGGALSPRPTAAMRSPSSSTSAANCRSALTTVPPAMKTGCGGSHARVSAWTGLPHVQRQGCSARRRTCLHLGGGRRGGGGGRGAEQRRKRERGNAHATPRGASWRAHVAMQRAQGARRACAKTCDVPSYETYARARRRSTGRLAHRANAELPGAGAVLEYAAAAAVLCSGRAARRQRSAGAQEGNRVTKWRWRALRQMRAGGRAASHAMSRASTRHHATRHVSCVCRLASLRSPSIPRPCSPPAAAACAPRASRGRHAFGARRRAAAPRARAAQVSCAATRGRHLRSHRSRRRNAR